MPSVKLKNTIKQNSTAVFVITNPLIIGALPLLLKMTDRGTVKNIYAICSKKLQDDCEIVIEKISEEDFELSNSWTSIFEENKNLVISKDSISNKNEVKYELNDAAINDGDILRLNVLKNGNGISGLTIEIEIELK